VNELLANSTEKDIQEAPLVKDGGGYLPIHRACIYKAPLEVIQMLLDGDVDKTTILVKDNGGRPPIHISCGMNARRAVIHLLLGSDDDKQTILVKDREGKLPIHRACEANAPVDL
jgi:ankyrin repeat protein